jgi:hypothetical protein
MQLATTDLFRARWTETIHEEWINALLAKRPDLKKKDLLRTKDLMNQNTRDCIIDGHQSLIETLELPDPNDRHVLAAAIRGRVDVIITFNLKDFPQETLLAYDIEAQHPDEFIAHLIDLEATAVLEAAKIVRARLNNPAKTAEEYLEILAKQGLSKTVDFLCDGISLI